MNWKPSDIPDQTGRTVLVTGCTMGGLGHHTAGELAAHGAHVVLGGRTAAKLEATEADILARTPGATVSRLLVDLASLDSVRSAAGRAEDLGPIHTLVNNAGIMATPYSRTVDGLESQLATNHFGPFLLTGLLLPQLVASGDGRVVALASQAHRLARSAPLGDPARQQGRYWRWRAYGESKLANLLFTFELDRRTRSANLPLKALAAHPGFSGTHLVTNGQLGRATGGVASILDAAVKVISQSAERGAWPTLMAATANLPGATYVGPSGPAEYAGPPTIVGSSRLARDDVAARRLWQISEDATGITYP